jgi:hypothetical protein
LKIEYIKTTYVRVLIRPEKTRYLITQGLNKYSKALTELYVELKNPEIIVQFTISTYSKVKL